MEATRVTGQDDVDEVSRRWRHVPLDVRQALIVCRRYEEEGAYQLSILATSVRGYFRQRGGADAVEEAEGGRRLPTLVERVPVAELAARARQRGLDPDHVRWAERPLPQGRGLILAYRDRFVGETVVVDPADTASVERSARKLLSDLARQVNSGRIQA